MDGIPPSDITTFLFGITGKTSLLLWEKMDLPRRIRSIAYIKKVNMEDKKFKKIVICIVLAVGIVFGFLALLNGRYISAHDVAFDQWAGKYVVPKNHRR